MVLTLKNFVNRGENFGEVLRECAGRVARGSSERVVVRVVKSGGRAEREGQHGRGRGGARAAEREPRAGAGGLSLWDAGRGRVPATYV